MRPPERTPQGFLRVDGIAARAGIQEYLNPNGTIRRELRPLSEVARLDSLAGYEGAPFVVGHPRAANGDPIAVTPSNVRTYSTGTVTGPGRMDGDHVITTAVITDPDTIARVERRELTHLSTGYAVDLVEQPGVDPKYGRYDAIQTNMVINHQALVKEGRAGVARLRLDEALTLVYPESSGSDKGNDHTIVDPSRNDHHPRGMTMDPEKLQATIVELNNNLKKTQTELGAATASANAEKLRADEAIGRLQTVESENKELRVKVQSIGDASATVAVQTEKLRADSAEEKVRELNTSFPIAVRARATLVAQAMTVLPEKFRTDDLSDRQVRIEAIKRMDSAAKVDNDVPDGVITGRYLSLIEGRSRNASSMAEVTNYLAQTPRVDERRVDDDAEKKRNEFRNQGSAPLPNSRFKTQTR